MPAAIRVLFSFILVVLFFYFTAELYRLYASTCPNQDVLSWDGNLRFMQALDLHHDLRVFRFTSLPRFILEAPTWPPLRPLITTALFFLTGEASTSVEIYLTIFTFITLFFVLIYIFYTLLKDIYPAILLGYTITTSLLLTDHLTKYILSAMLEVQGMALFSLSLFAVYRLYNSVLKSGGPGKGDSALIFASIFGLYFTKYPYGVIFILALILYETALHRHIYWRLTINFFKDQSIRGWMLSLTALLLFSLTAFVVVRKSGNIRAASNFLFLLAWIFLIIASILYYKNRDFFRSALPITLRVLLAYAILPVLIWTIANPDRITGILDTQAHIQNENTLFFKSYFSAVYIYSAIPIITLLSILFGLYRLWRLREHTSLSDFTAEPAVAVLITLLVQFLILEITTGNKQLRHIYHMLPGMALCAVLILISPDNLRLFKFESRFAYITLTVVSLFITLHIFYANPARKSGICFTGDERKAIDPARWVASRISRPSRYLLINEFHRKGESTQYQNLASEFDLLLRMGTAGEIRNDSKYRHKNWNDFDELLVLNDGCEIEPTTEIRVSDILRKRPKKTDEFIYPDGNLCLGIYSLR
jgi:hypothetical protein